jgi:uncharacterized protein (DUF1330 family)
MPKAYWIARVDVNDLVTYQKYLDTARPAFERHKCRFLVRGGAMQVLEGTGRARNVVIEFESMQEALSCYNSTEYTAAREYRVQSGIGEFILVEGI